MGVEAGKAYLDSLRQSDEGVWLGQSYKKCEALQIGLGLDLKGGMNVILEVSVPDVVKNLAGSGAEDPKVKKIIAEAQAEAAKSSDNFLDVFVSKYQKEVGANQLGGLFSLRLKEDGITPSSTDAQVKAALEKEIKAAVSNSYQVVQQRIDRFGVAQPNIQILEGRGQMGQIMVEMPGIKEPERVRKLLQGSANLEFWETYTLGDVQPALQALDTRLAQINSGKTSTDSTKVDSTQTAQKAEPVTQKVLASFKANRAALNKEGASAKEDAARKEALKAHPLLAVMQLGHPKSAIVGYVRAADTAAVNKAIHSEVAKEILPADLNLAWGVNAEKGVYELYALRRNNGGAVLAGEVVENAKDDFDQYHKPVVSMTMTPEGAREWATVTRNNLKKAVALSLIHI